MSAQIERLSSAPSSRQSLQRLFDPLGSFLFGTSVDPSNEFVQKQQ